MSPLQILFACILSTIILLLLIAFCVKLCKKDTLNITQELGWTWINFPPAARVGGGKCILREDSRSDIIQQTCEPATTDQTMTSSIYCIKDTRLQIEPSADEPCQRQQLQLQQQQQQQQQQLQHLTVVDPAKFCDMQANATKLENRLSNGSV